MKFEELGLPYSSKIQLSIGRDSERHYGVELLGLIAGNSIMVSPPINEFNKIVILKPSQSVSLQFGWRNAIFSCHASVIKLISAPFAYYHLSIPQELIMQEVRQALRVNAALEAVVVNVDDKKHSYQAKITDLSTGGLKLESSQAVAQIGDYLAVAANLALEEFQQQVHLKCKVCNLRIVNQGEGQRKYLYGIQLVGLEKEQLLALKAYVYQQKLRELKAL